jgi:myo-inositol-hexaphosphate 3-phosphohydrolase
MRASKRWTWIAAAVLAGASAASVVGNADAAVSASFPAQAETTPVEHATDAADDPAIWVHPSDRAQSLIVGTDKLGALEVYGLDGQRLQRFPGDFGNNVDIRGNIVVSSDDNNRRLHVYRVNATTRRLEPVGDVVTKIRPHGICLYESPFSGALYALPNAGSGVVVQYQLTVGASSVTAVQRRRFDVGTAVEGCAADESTGALYISEENAQKVWRYGAEPSWGTDRTLVDSFATTGHIVGDAEGIAIAGSRIFVSSQGDSAFLVYDRTSNDYLGRFTVTAGASADACSGTDGIEAYAGALGPSYPDGLFICQDTRNTLPGTRGHQDFKLVDLGPILAAFS